SSVLFTNTATSVVYTLSLHDALPIYWSCVRWCARRRSRTPQQRRLRQCAAIPLIHSRLHAMRRALTAVGVRRGARHSAFVRRLRSEEHTSELQSRENLVCRLLLEKKK